MIKKLISQHVFYLVLLCAFALYATHPLYVSPDLHSAHDIWHQVARLYHYSEAVSEGSFPPTWIHTLANGYGYPLFIFSYHMPWMIGAPLVLLGLSVFTTIKTVFFLAYLAAGVGMYLYMWGQTHKKLPAAIAALAYLYAPYHFLTLYVSAAIGTAFLFAALPFIFLGIESVFAQKRMQGLLIIAVATAAAILSHLMTFIYVLGFVFLYVVYAQLANRVSKQVSLKKLWQDTGYIFLGVLLGFALSGFYIIPLFANYPYIQAQGANTGFGGLYTSNFVTVRQLLYSPWGFGPIISNAKDGEISFQVGVGQWLAVFGSVAAVLLWRIQKKKLASEQTILFLLLAFALSIFGMIDSSAFLWDFVTQYISLDYPFRLLLFAVFFGSALVGQLVYILPKKQLQWIAVFLFAAVLTYTNRNHIRVNMYTQYPLELYIASETTTNTFHEYLPKKASGELLSVVYPVAATGSAVVVHNTVQTAATFLVEVELAEKQTVILQQLDYPGQTVVVNGEAVEHSVTDKGQMQVELPEGTHVIEVVFRDQNILQAGKIASVLTIFVLSYLWYKHKRCSCT